MTEAAISDKMQTLDAQSGGTDNAEGCDPTSSNVEVLRRLDKKEI